MTNLAGSAHTVTATSGSGQSATVGTAFTNPLGATVTDQYGNPVSGVTVTFTPPGSGASGTFTTSATAVTNAAGLATSNTYTANTIAGGPYNVVASATGAASANFAETNTAKTTNDTLSLVSGTPQSATVNTAFGAPLVVKDVDQYGNLVSGVTVTFAPPGSGASGTFTTSATAVTNTSGVATSHTYTANTTAGSYNVVASAPGATPTISFAMTNNAGSAHTVTATSGTNQSATVSTAFTNPLGATVTDQYGNPVSGVTVTFTPPTGSVASGTFTTSATAVTNPAGLATSNTYTANTIAGGPYNVVASAPGATDLSLVPGDQPRRFGPHGHGDLGVGPERDGGHGLHQPAGRHGHRPVQQPRLGCDGHVHSPDRHGRLGHLHHLGHRGHQCRWPGHLEHLHGQHDRRRPLQRRGLGHGSRLGELRRDQHGQDDQ